MVKRIIVLMILSLLFVGCGESSSKNVPKRVTIDNNGMYGMVYHVKLYLPERDRYGDMYIPMHFYTDSLETQSADNVIWKTYSFDDVPFDEMGEDLSQVQLTFSNEKLDILGFIDGYKGLNGTYKIETSSPESWGVPIIE